MKNSLRRAPGFAAVDGLFIEVKWQGSADNRLHLLLCHHHREFSIHAILNAYVEVYKCMCGVCHHPFKIVAALTPFIAVPKPPRSETPFVLDLCSGVTGLTRRSSLTDSLREGLDMH